MKKSIEREMAIAAYNVLSRVNLVKLDKALRRKVLYVSMSLKPVERAFDDFLKDTRERLKPENWEEVQKLAQKNKESLSDVEKGVIEETVRRYDEEVNSCMQAFLKEKVEIELAETFGPEDLPCLPEGQEQMNGGTLMLIGDVCGE